MEKENRRTSQEAVGPYLAGGGRALGDATHTPPNAGYQVEQFDNAFP